jgi:hypothetical protein
MLAANPAHPVASRLIEPGALGAWDDSKERDHAQERCEFMID